jgi:hypothetical protein
MAIMQLAIKTLNNASTVNNLMYLNQTTVTPGETKTIYFQLIDSDTQFGNRYIPTVGSTVTIEMNCLNKNNNISKIATNPIADDRSIWAFNLSSSETNTLAGINMTVTVVDGANIIKSVAEGVIIVKPKSFSQA